MRRILITVIAIVVSLAAHAGGLTGTFRSIDGGSIALEDWRGRPVLVTNTASRCGYTGQYAQLQALYDRYKDDGLVVLAVPSQDFRQELSSADAVKSFCEVNFGLTLPMTDITPVRGPTAHPFYRQLKATQGFEPRWNFNKVLIGPQGDFVRAWRASVKPDAPDIIQQIENLLGKQE